MKTRVLGLFTTILVFGLISVSAQTETNVNPYVPGENITFAGKYKKFGLSFSVGEFSFAVSRAENGKDYFVKSRAKSKGALIKLFNFKFLQKFDSTVSADALNILKTVKRDEQGKRVRDSQADFDYKEKNVTWVETDPKDSTRPPKRVASSIGLNTQDIVTSVYMLRQQPLAIGKKFVFKVSDSGLVYDVPVSVIGRERKSSILGKLWCWKIEPDIFGEGKFIEQKGSLTIWITDDTRRIPVRAKLKTKFGDVNIKIKTYRIDQPKNETS